MSDGDFRVHFFQIQFRNASKCYAKVDVLKANKIHTQVITFVFKIDLKFSVKIRNCKYL